MTDIVRIPFHDGEILSVRDERTGKVYVLPKHTCENVLGLNWPTQYRKLTTSPDFSTAVVKLTMPSDGGKQETLLLEKHMVGSQGYLMDDDPRAQGSQTHSELFGLWLAGECYAP